jgi:putative hemolysin
MHLKQLHPVFIPVNKHGSQSTANAKLMEDAFASSDQILYFPAGLCSRKQKGGIIEDLEWKKSFIAKAVKHERDVVPVFFSGRNSKFFYNLARIRSKLGLKANIEMLYLVDEMYRQKGQSITVTFGKPIPYQTFDKSKTPQQWAEWVKRMVYQISTSTK